MNAAKPTVAVVGGGFAGAMAAWYLVRCGAIVLEALGYKVTLEPAA